MYITRSPPPLVSGILVCISSCQLQDHTPQSSKTNLHMGRVVYLTDITWCAIYFELLWLYSIEVYGEKHSRNWNVKYSCNLVILVESWNSIWKFHELFTRNLRESKEQKYFRRSRVVLTRNCFFFRYRSWHFPAARKWTHSDVPHGSRC